MKTSLALALALASADKVEIAANGDVAADDCDDTEGFEWGLCLLQTQFLQKTSKLSSENFAPSHPPTSECPGAPVEHFAQLDKCSFEGVSIVTKDGSSITSFFDDNVEMKDFHWYVNGQSDVWVDLETHPFPVGTSTATVEGRDLAGNKQACHRTVVITDHQKPKWLVTSAETELTIYVDEECQKAASVAFAEYEAMGWVPEGGDNCGVASINKQVKKDGVVVYDESDETLSGMLKGPGIYELVYTIVDIHGLSNRHTAILHLEDKTPPEVIEQCSEDIFVEIEAHLTTGVTHWFLPHVVKDNCLAFGKLPLPIEVSGIGSFIPMSKEEADNMRRTHTFTVGDHQIAYPILDAFGNVFKHECKFTVSVKQKAHPVTITCPADVTTNTFELAPFGAPDWPTPTATQGPDALDASHITYLNGAGPLKPFIYGSTTVTARAQGKVTGDRTREEEQSDECTFKVTVNDPFRPFVDGRHLRCESALTGGVDSAGVEPYGVCEGANLDVIMHAEYTETGGYDLSKGVTIPAGKACCNDEVGIEHSCQAGTSPLFKYCKPKSEEAETDAEEDAEEAEEDAVEAEGAADENVVPDTPVTKTQVGELPVDATPPANDENVVPDTPVTKTQVGELPVEK